MSVKLLYLHGQRSAKMKVFRIGIILAITVSILQSGDALKCMQCSKSSEPGDCGTTVECPSGESCYTEFYISPEGFLFYDMGCQPDRVCKAIAAKKKRSADKRLFETLPLCQECCDGDYCNSQGCLNQVTPLVNTTVCYKCDDVKNPWDCDYVEPCVHSNEICATTQTLDYDNFEVRYKLDCMSRERCNKIAGSQTDGHPVANHKRRELESRDMNKRDAINTCIYCCEDDFCNDRDCKTGPTSMTTKSYKTTVTSRTTQSQKSPTPKPTLTTQTLKTTQKSTTQSTTTQSSRTSQPSTTHANIITSKSTTQKPQTSKPTTTKQTTPMPRTQKQTTLKSKTSYPTTTQKPIKPQTPKLTSKSQTPKPSISKATSIPTTTSKPTTLKLQATKLRTPAPTTISNILSTWISASTNKNPKTTQRPSVWISAHTNSKPSNWITVPKATKPLTWVSAKTDPIFYSATVYGK